MSATHFPILRWGEPYRSLDVDNVVHFATGEPIAEISRTNPGLVARDMRRAAAAREALLTLDPLDLIDRLGRAADLFMDAELPAGDGKQTPEQFVRSQSATTGLPERLCRANMDKLHYVLTNLRAILASLMRGLDPHILSRGYGEENGVMRSYQAASPVLGMVLPSNSPGVHGLWLPVPALQVGLVIKPGPQEPWTPFRMIEAFAQAGIPRQAFSIYPGGADIGAAVVEHGRKTLLFGGAATVDRYRGNPRVQVHGPGFSKIILGEDAADRWEDYIDLMVESVLSNSGRSCVNCSGIWTPRHGGAIAEALAERLGPVAPLPPNDPGAVLAAFTVKEQAEGVNALIERGLAEPGVDDVTAAWRMKHEGGDGSRLITHERCAYLRPTVIACDNPTRTLANTEYMFPFVSVVQCPRQEMIERIGDTLVATAITADEGFRRQLLDATNIDRLNLGPIPTVRLNWMQPHEGNLVDFLFRARAFQMA
ncbi:MAG: aldehyde dehydrogenase [Phycisphaeraceae bacterium]|nr:aldehyde dehydrogenase family protein [Phycisphaerales bacterium]QOJ18725.1 MAG: aldehyde dehydrogenase [Phycisphaeraceae bacterium]